jgi:hypothetical protein
MEGHYVFYQSKDRTVTLSQDRDSSKAGECKGKLADLQDDSGVLRVGDLE